MCSKNCWSFLCLGLFVMGLIFLTPMGILCYQESDLTNLKKGLRKTAGGASFIALGLYAISALCSILYLYWSGTRMRKVVKEEIDASKMRRRTVQNSRAPEADTLLAESSQPEVVPPTNEPITRIGSLLVGGPQRGTSLGNVPDIASPPKATPM